MSGKPFLFDKNFFDDDSLAAKAEENDPSIPEFTKEELENEKQKAYEEGKKAGFQESETGLTKNILSLLEKIERDITILFAAEDDRKNLFETESLHLSYTVIEKLFPLYAQKYGEKEVHNAIKMALKKYNTPEKIKIELQEDMKESLEDYLKNSEHDLSTKIEFSPNSHLQKNECRILWSNGGIIDNRTTIAEKTLEIMKDALAEHGISVHDESEVTEDKPPQANDQAGDA